MTYGTKNFSLNSDKKIECNCGDARCNKPRLTQCTLVRAQLIRDDYGKPMIITSGARCQYHPDEKHRKPGTGDHQKLETIDFACDNPLDETRIKVLAGRHGATRVAGTYKDGFVHVSWTPTDRRDVPTWSYQ